MSVKPFSTINSAEELTRTGYIYKALQYLDNLLKGIELPDCEGDLIKNIAPYNVRKSILNSGNLIIEVSELEQEGQFRGSTPLYWRNNGGKLEFAINYDDGPWEWVKAAQTTFPSLYFLGDTDGVGASTSQFSYLEALTNDVITFWGIYFQDTGYCVSTPIYRVIDESQTVLFELGIASDQKLYCTINGVTYYSAFEFLGSNWNNFHWTEIGVCLDQGNNQLWFFNGHQSGVAQACASWFPAHDYETHQLSPLAYCPAFALKAFACLPYLVYPPSSYHFPRHERIPSRFLQSEFYWKFDEEEGNSVYSYGIYPNEYRLTVNSSKTTWMPTLLDTETEL